METDYIPLSTDEFRLAFCQATNSLCTDVQRIIWKKTLYDDPILIQPPTPKKCSVIYSRTCTASLPPNLFTVE